LHRNRLGPTNVCKTKATEQEVSRHGGAVGKEGHGTTNEMGKAKDGGMFAKVLLREEGKTLHTPGGTKQFPLGREGEGAKGGMVGGRKRGFFFTFRKRVGQQYQRTSPLGWEQKKVIRLRVEGGTVRKGGFFGRRPCAIDGKPNRQGQRARQSNKGGWDIHGGL